MGPALDRHCPYTIAGLGRGFNAQVAVLVLTTVLAPLHLSLLGIRDISVLQTPPRGRQAIRTEVCRYDHGKIRAAILRELGRDGQVFFVHNRVRSNIKAVARRCGLYNVDLALIGGKPLANGRRALRGETCGAPARIFGPGEIGTEIARATASGVQGVRVPVTASVC